MPSKQIPKISHFVNCGEMTQQQAEYIKLWAKLNSDYKVIVWRDIEAVTDQFIFKTLYKHVAEIEFGRPGSLGLTLRDFAKSVENAYHSLFFSPFRNIGTGDDGLNNKFVKIVLKSYLKEKNSGEFKQILQSQKMRYDSLKSSPNIEIKKVSSKDSMTKNLIFQGNNELSEVYNKFRYGNAHHISEFILSLASLKTQGGFYINSGVLPPLNPNLFRDFQKEIEDRRELMGEPRKIPDDIQLLFNKATLELVLNRVKESGDLSGDIQLSAVSKLRETEYSAILAQLKDRIEKSIPDSLFIKLGDQHLDREGSIILESSDTPSHTRVAVMGLTSESPLLTNLLRYHKHVCSLKDMYVLDKEYTLEKFQKQVADACDTYLIHHSHSSGSVFLVPDPVKTKWAVDAYYSLDLLNVAPELDRYGEVFGDSMLRKYNRGSGSGKPVRLFSKHHVYPPYKEVRVATIQPPVKYVKGQNYDSQMVVSVDNDPWIYTESYIIYSNKMMKKNVLFQYDGNHERLLLVHGKTFIPDDRTRIILVGHGSENGFEAVGTESLVDILIDLIPENGKVKRIVFSGCEIAHSSHGLSGEIAADTDMFVPAVLRRLKAIKRFTHDAAASKTPIRANFLGNNIFVHNPDENAKVDFRKKPYSRYVYSLKDDDVVSYTVKENLPALSPDIQLRPDLFDQNELTRILDHKPITNHETSVDIASHNILIDSNIENIIAMGTLESLNERAVIVVAEPDRIKLEHLQEVLFTSNEFTMYGEWKTLLDKKHSDLTGNYSAPSK